MTVLAFKNACHRFAQAAAPYMLIKNEQHYQETLELVETFLQEAKDSHDDPLNGIIELLARAIESYENKKPELAAFDHRSMAAPSDVATLRLLMDQHGLGTADLPEIGSKSMVSRVLSGERSLNKNHIQALAQRFSISPSLFF